MPKFMVIDSAVRTTIGSIGLLLNGLQMSCILKKAQTKLPFDLTVLSLSVADIITALALLVFGIYDVLVAQDIVSAVSYLENINEAALDLSIVTSLIHVEYIAVQRLLAVLYPIRFHILFTKFRCKVGLVFIWLVCAAYCTWSSWEKTRNSPSFIIMSYTIIISIFFLLLSYLTICFKVFRKRRISRTTSRNDHTIFFNSLLVATAFLVCTIPFTLQTLGIIKSNTFYQFIIPKWVLFLNIILDPIIYFLLKYYRIHSHKCLFCFQTRRYRESSKNQIPLLPFRRGTQKTTIETKEIAEPNPVGSKP